MNNNNLYECEGCGRKYAIFEDASKCEQTHDCCISKTEKKKGFLKGIFYGLVPHTFCILFVLAAIIGATTAVSLFKPFLMNRNFFYILIALSFVFATISSMFYLKRNNCLCLSGARKRWKYLSVMYATTIGINILFFLVIFPAVANFSPPSVTASSINTNLDGFPSFILKVDIPCSGHAPLIIGELKNVQGVIDAKYVSGNFNVIYDPSQTSKDKILAIDVFKEYPAKLVSESNSSSSQTSNTQAAAASSTSGGSCGGGNGESGGCGGGCCGK